MEEVKLNIHSVVDLITNSSTVIYTNSSGVKTIKEVLNTLIKEMGGEKSADELFDVRIDWTDDALEEAIGEWLDEDEDEKKKLMELLPDDENFADFKSGVRSWVNNKIAKFVVENYPDKEYEKYIDEDSYSSNDVCIITSKATGKETNFTSLILRAVSQDAMHDGQ